MKRDRRFKKNNVIIIYIDFKNNNKQSYTQNSIEYSTLMGKQHENKTEKEK